MSGFIDAEGTIWEENEHVAEEGRSLYGQARDLAARMDTAREVAPVVVKWYSGHCNAHTPSSAVVAFAQGYLFDKTVGANLTLGELVKELQEFAESEEKDLGVALDSCGSPVPPETKKEKEDGARVARSLARMFVGTGQYDLDEKILGIGKPKQKEIEYGGRTQD